MNTAENWYEIADVATIDSPALVVYPERVEANIQTLITAVGDPLKLRPHIKTCKAKEPVLLMQKAGIRKFKCATIAEAETLALCGAEDVLLAYQPTEVKLHRFLELQQNFPRTHSSCLVDNRETAQTVSRVAVANSTTVAVFIDLNVGMNRTGILPDEAFALYKAAGDLPGILLRGLHAYDGHIHDVDLQQRRAESERCFAPVEQLRSDLEKNGYTLPLLVAGGSPTALLHTDRNQVEVSPGTFVFWDWGYRESIPEQPFLFAAVVVTRVISLPARDKICIDLGHKSIASENPLSKRVFSLNAPQLQPVSHSEEHMVLQTDAGDRFRIGDVLYAVPYHICPTVALYRAAVTVSENKVSGNWQIIGRERRISV